MIRTRFAATLAVLALGASAQETIRVGVIGLDSSHAPAFARLLNIPEDKDHVPGARVVAAFPGGSPDLEDNAGRLARFRKEMEEVHRIPIAGSIEEMVGRVDAVMITSVDGRRHLAEARPVLAARKRL